MVDRIISLEPGVSIEAEKTLDASEELFRDHFPGFPVVPGVLLTEMMAQAAGKCVDAEKHSRGKAMLGEIRSARFRSWVRPGETAQISAKIVKNLRNLAIAQCNINIDGRKICSAEILILFLPRDQLAVDFADEVLDRYLASQAAAAAAHST